MTVFGPTAVGDFVQGGAKFAGYEFWKKQFVARAGDKDMAVRYRTAIYLGTASVGEFVFLMITPSPLSYFLTHILSCQSPLDLGAQHSRIDTRFFVDVLLTPPEATRIRMERPARSRLRRSNGTILKRVNNIRRAILRASVRTDLGLLCAPSLTSSLQNLHLCRPCAPVFRPPCRQGWGHHGIRCRGAALEAGRHATTAVRALSRDVCAAEHWLPRGG